MLPPETNNVQSISHFAQKSKHLSGPVSKLCFNSNGLFSFGMLLPFVTVFILSIPNNKGICTNYNGHIIRHRKMCITPVIAPLTHNLLFKMLNVAFTNRKRWTRFVGEWYTYTRKGGDRFLKNPLYGVSRQCVLCRLYACDDPVFFSLLISAVHVRKTFYHRFSCCRCFLWQNHAFFHIQNTA